MAAVNQSGGYTNDPGYAEGTYTTGTNGANGQVLQKNEFVDKDGQECFRILPANSSRSHIYHSFKFRPRWGSSTTQAGEESRTLRAKDMAVY